MVIVGAVPLSTRSGVMDVSESASPHTAKKTTPPSTRKRMSTVRRRPIEDLRALDRSAAEQSPMGPSLTMHIFVKDVAILGIRMARPNASPAAALSDVVPGEAYAKCGRGRAIKLR